MQARKKEGSGPNITEISHRGIQRAKAPTLCFMPWNTLIAIPQLLGRIFPPSPSWGQCYEYPLQLSKLRQAAATDGICVGKCLVMWTSAFTIWFIAWIKITSFQAGMHHITHKIVALPALLFNLKRVKLQGTWQVFRILHTLEFLHCSPFLPIPRSFPADMRSLFFRVVMKENKYLCIGCSSRATWNWLL